MFKAMIAAAQRDAMHEPAVVECSECELHYEVDLDKVCNGCVETGTFKCTECATAPALSRCAGCAQQVGACHSKVLARVILEDDGTVHPVTATLCRNTSCIEHWLDEQNELLLGPHQRVFVSLNTYTLLQHLKTHKLDFTAAVETKKTKRAHEDDDKK